MKILGIKFKNISSLQGEWEIRFDRPPLSDTGLFAIVGPNGSGKSSILDALTLGLYGETARLKDPESEITSWQADESYSEVTFRVGEDVYRGRWWVRKNGNGLLGPEMSLSGVNGGESLLEDRVIRVRSRIAELTGLDFKRFCRSVLLAQGEFTAFLNALENERAEILEKIIGTEMAQELEQEVRSRAREEQERLLQLKESAASYAVLDRERLEELEQALEQDREELDEAARSLEELESLRESLETVGRLEAEEQDAREAMTEEEVRNKEVQKNLARLEKARPALPFAEDVRGLEDLGARKEAAQHQLDAAVGDIPSGEARLREMEEQLSRNRTELEEARKRLEERGGELADALRRDREIEAETQRFLEAVSRYEAVEQSRKEMLGQQEDLNARIAEGAKRAELIRRSLEQHAPDVELDGAMEKIETLASRLTQIRGRLGECHVRSTDSRKLEQAALKVLRRAERAENKARRKADRSAQRKAGVEQRLNDLLGTETAELLASGIQERKKKIAACGDLLALVHRYQEEGLTGDVHGDLARVTTELDSLEASLDRDRERLKELEAQIAWRDTFRRLSGERSMLKTGDPCPLCGSMAHPFLEQGLPDLSELNRTVEALETGIGSLEAERADLAGRSERLVARARAAEKMQQEWAAACERAGGGWDITDAELIQNEIRVQEAAIKNGRSLIRSTRWKKWRLSWLGMILGRKLEKLSRREKIRAGLQEQHESKQRALLDLEGEQQGLREEEKAIQAELAEGIRPYGETVPDSGGEAALLERLKTRDEDFRRWCKESEDLTGERRSLEPRRDALALELERVRAEAAALASETESIQAVLAPLKAERDSLYAGLDPAREQQALEDQLNRLTAEQVEWAQGADALFQALEMKRRMLPRLETECQEAKSAFESAERSLLERVAGAGIDSLGAAREALTTLENEETLLQEASMADQATAEARTRAAAAQDALRAARSGREGDDTLQTVGRRIGEAMKACDALREKVGDAETVLDERRRVEREYQDVLRAVEAQEKICADVAAEESMLRAGDGAEIRRKVQRLMLDRLVDQSNAHLALLSGRYLLRAAVDDGLGFQVEDSAQRKTHRSVKTLSGGESFLVSLCLALALSELAADHRKIDSLFLDEGFGTLDEETLYRVMAALKGLRSNGKMVGVISHVKRLADEIPTQIRVEREPGGQCRLMVVA